MQLTGTTIRVAANQAIPNSFVNAIGGGAPLIPRASSVQIPCAVFLGDATQSSNLLSDFSNIVSANLVARLGGTPTGTVFFEQVIPGSRFNNGVAVADWQAGAAAHFTFSMSPTDTNQTPSAGQTTIPIWLAIGLTTTNAGDVSITYSANGQIKDYGIFNPGAPTAADYTSWSKAESDARYLGAATGINYIATITGATGGGGCARKGKRANSEVVSGVHKR